MRISTASLVKYRKNVEKYKKRYTSSRIRTMSLKAGASEVEEEAKKQVTVLSGELRDSIGKKVEGESVLVTVSAPHATVSEYKDKPFMRPAAKIAAHKAVSAIANAYRLNV